MSLDMIKPAALQRGDLVRLVAPSSPPKDEASLREAITGMESLGYRICYSDVIFRKNGFLAGTDEERAGDFQEAFEDPEVKAVFCLRGGYGAGRLLSRIDWNRVCAHPKVFMGFSDITAISCGLWVRGGMVTFSGPVVMSDLDNGKPLSISWDHARSCFESTEPLGSIFSDVFSRQAVRVISSGSAQGRLVGGNLSILCSLLGTSWQPDFRGAILFLEDVAEPTYRIDRCLTQLRNAGVLSAVAGIALGDFCYSENQKKNDQRLGVQVLDEVLADVLCGLAKPVVAGFPFGHIKPKATIPFGCMATIDGEQGDLVIEESGVQ